MEVGIRQHGLYLGHVAHTRRRAADSHACLQVVDSVCDGGDEDEEDEDDEEDDDVALHGCGVWVVFGLVWCVVVFTGERLVYTVYCGGE
jgi:hypothetical protein